MAENDARRKILRFPARNILSLFHLPGAVEVRGLPHWVDLPVIPDIPKDAHIVSIFTDWRSTSIDFIATHPSWPEVEDGMDPPVVHVFEEWRVLTGYEFVGGTAPQKLETLPEKPGHYWYRTSGYPDWRLIIVHESRETGETCCEEALGPGEWTPVVYPPF